MTSTFFNSFAYILYYIIACTAVVTEIAYHNKSTIAADISFLSEKEWKQELSVLLHDLVDEDGNVKRVTDLKSDAGVAWQKVYIFRRTLDLLNNPNQVHAVYPKITQEDLVKMTVNQLLSYDASELDYCIFCRLL
jgi:hypothetical protein